MARQKLTTCRKCPKPRVKYTVHGVERTRPYCDEHWTEYMGQRRKLHNLRQSHGGITFGEWQVVRSKRLRPPKGMRRVIIVSGRGRLTFYEGNRRRIWDFRRFHVLNTARKLVEFHMAIGYTLVGRTSDGHRYVLERRARRDEISTISEAWEQAS